MYTCVRHRECASGMSTSVQSNIYTAVAAGGLVKPRVLWYSMLLKRKGRNGLVVGTGLSSHCDSRDVYVRLFNADWRYLSWLVYR